MQWVRPVVAVGVTGHRTLAAPDKLRSAVDKILAQITTAAQAALASDLLSGEGETFNLRIISPAAEGADRLVAEAGLAIGATLQCPLPLPKDDYAQDFATAESRAAYDALLAKAERVFELDAPRERNDAYLNVGRLVLSQSDVLIAIWDGQPAKGRGGTAEIVAEALVQRTPVIWLKPDMSDPPVLITGSVASLVHHEINDLVQIVARLVTPPPVERDEDGHGCRLPGRSIVCAACSGGIQRIREPDPASFQLAEAPHGTRPPCREPWLLDSTLRRSSPHPIRLPTLPG
jgi:hypothetical protein